MGIKTKLSRSPTIAKELNTIIGTGGSIWAKYGDMIVIMQATQLHIPKAVAQNNVGNRSIVAAYTRQ